MALARPAEAVADCREFLGNNSEAVQPEFYVLFVGAMIKNGTAGEAERTCREALEMFPYHKKIQELLKLCQEKSIVNDE